MRLHDIREQSIKTFFQFQSQPQRNSSRSTIQWIIFHRIDLQVIGAICSRTPFLPFARAISGGGAIFGQIQCRPYYNWFQPPILFNGDDI
jgi:hypothetical protein